MIVLYAEDVEDDLDAIAEYIAADNPRRAVSFLREIHAAIQRIGESPLLYQQRPDIGPDARLAVVGRYVILFRIANDVAYIERIVYGGRDLPVLFEPRVD
jgi:plasmid stabilization system protein ParE